MALLKAVPWVALHYVIGIFPDHIVLTNFLRYWIYFKVRRQASIPIKDNPSVTPTDPFPRVEGRGGGGLWVNICEHVAAFVKFFNLICNITMF